MPPLVKRLFADVASRHPRSLKGIEEARAVSEEEFDRIAEMFLQWLISAKGQDAICHAVDAFVQFSTDVNFAQARYEISRSYQHKSFDEVYREHYSQHEEMSGYLWGIFLTNFLWAHHAEISLFFKDRFIPKTNASCEFIEIAPGHGGWGTWALTERTQATLKGFDISPTSIQISRLVATAAGTAGRAMYEERNALDLSELPRAGADAVICSFLVEHLEDPKHLFSVIGHLLRPNGVAFVTAALTAAQVDHIYEINFESEVLRLAESAGLRVIESLSANPRRVLRNASFIPRSMAILCVPRKGEYA